VGSPRLQDVFDALRSSLAGGRQPCCVFDLDSTLLNSRRRSFRILEKFVAVQGQRFPGLAERVSEIRDDELGYSVFEPLEGYPCLTPLLRRDLKRFWGKRFFTSRWCEADTPIPGAVEFVRACSDAGAYILYLTARDTPQMDEGTSVALAREGFPWPEGDLVELQMKPAGGGQDENFKAVAIRVLRERDLDVVATFENEPGNANLFADAFPAGLHFLLETVCSPGAEQASELLIPTRDFLSS
jgi:hypothetical protein